MKVLKLKLFKYKRFLLSGIENFEMDVDSPLTIVLGTNGTGKSSLLDVLNPLPAVRMEFGDGGYKDITVESRGSVYHLKSEFNGKSGHHSFIKDNEEDLNPGGTGAVQRELVEKHLGYNQSLHDILTGRVKLTQMVPAKRNQWIMSLSSTDFTYANKVFDAMKTSARDALGALKHSKNRLVKESARLLDTEKVSFLESKVQELNADLELLFKHKTRTESTASQIKHEIQTIADRMLSNATTLKTKYSQGHFLHGNSIESLTAELEQQQIQLAKINTRIEAGYEELDKLKTAVCDVDEEGVDSIDSLEGKLTVLYEQKSNHPIPKEEYRISGDPEQHINDTQSAREAMVIFLRNLPMEFTPSKTKEECIAISDAIGPKKDKLGKITAALSHREARQEHIEACETSTCPKCTYSWKQGIQEDELAKLKFSIVKGTELKERLEKEIKEDEVILSEYRDYVAIHRNFNSFFTTYPRLFPVWALLKENNLLETGRNLILHEFDDWMHHLEINQSLFRINQEIERCEKSLGYLKDLGGDAKHFKNRIAVLEEQLNVQLSEKEAVLKNIRTLESSREDMANYISCLESTALDSERYGKLYNRYIETLKVELIDEAVSKTTSDLAILQSRLNEKDTMLGIVKDIEDTVRGLEVDYEAWKLLTDVLSPQKGWIAKQMNGFIGHLVEQMNLIISKIWEYDLEVKPCGMETGKLDYKFPLHFHKDGKSGCTKDISEGSTAQKDVVDFAFMLVVMLYKDLQDYPMFLDETGASFDPAHRTRLMNFINQHLDNQRCSQIYLVSHYATFSGGLSNADICVLDKSNIAVPDTYNQNVTIG